jgi:uncharacterized protein (DUF427 family)
MQACPRIARSQSQTSEKLRSLNDASNRRRLGTGAKAATRDYTRIVRCGESSGMSMFSKPQTVVLIVNRESGVHMVEARWGGELIAQSDACVVVEGNQYFPAADVPTKNLRPSTTTSVCPWKGTAHYYDVVVGDRVHKDAAWYYPDPKQAAAEIKDRIAFWKGVEVRV